MLNIEEVYSRLQCCYTGLLTKHLENVSKLIFDKELDSKVSRAYNLIKLKNEGYLDTENDYKIFVTNVNEVCSYDINCECCEVDNDTIWIEAEYVCEESYTTTSSSTSTTTQQPTSTTTSSTTTTTYIPVPIPTTTTTTTTTTTSTSTTSTSTSTTSTTSSSTTTTKKNCDHGPILNQILIANVDGLQFLFDGVNVTSINWRVKLNGNIIRNGIVNPVSNSPFIIFSPFLTQGQYLLEIEGANCNSAVSSKPFAIEVGGGGSPTTTSTTSTSSSTTTTTNNVSGNLDFSVHYSNSN